MTFGFPNVFVPDESVFFFLLQKYATRIKTKRKKIGRNETHVFPPRNSSLELARVNSRKDMRVEADAAMTRGMEWGKRKRRRPPKKGEKNATSQLFPPPPPPPPLRSAHAQVDVQDASRRASRARERTLRNAAKGRREKRRDATEKSERLGAFGT